MTVENDDASRHVEGTPDGPDRRNGERSGSSHAAPSTDDASLLPHHREHLLASGILPDVIVERGYRSIRVKSELRSLGFGVSQLRVPTLLIPIRDPSGAISNYQSRPDEPRVKDGKAIKYETPSKSRMALDIPPRVRHQLKDPKLPLFITEGVKKADSAASRGILCIALLGVWNWRGSNEFGGKVALADWESIALNRRDVYIAFDSDVMTKPQVHAALARLKAFLESREARVRIIYLPSGEHGAKVGLDDYLAVGHAVDDLIALATSELRRPPVDPDAVPATYEVSPKGIVWNKPTRDGTCPVLLTNFCATISSQDVMDDGISSHRTLRVEASCGARRAHADLTTAGFAGMDWPVEILGAEAFILPGFGNKDHARTAIQVLSGSPQENCVHVHTGWRKLERGWEYLHAGGSIGADGLHDDVRVQLPKELRLFSLPAPLTGDAVRDAIRAALRFLDVAPDTVTAPLLSAIWRAALGPSDFTLWLHGGTGERKTALAVVLQQFFGAGLDRDHLVATWISTANVIESLLFVLKDSVLLVDDFAPEQGARDAERQRRDAGRILRSQGNRSGRQRMNADSSLQQQRSPRSTLLCTAESAPRGESVLGRTLLVELPAGSVHLERLTACQIDADRGLFAAAMATFLRWCAPQYDLITEFRTKRVHELRGLVQAHDAHARTAGIIAELGLGFEQYLLFAKQAGVISDQESRDLWERCWSALNRTVSAQVHHHAASDPAKQFLNLLRAALFQGSAHLVGTDGQAPPSGDSWGWRFEAGTARSQGRRIGYLDGEQVYLEPDAAYAAAQRLAADQGESLLISMDALWKRLHEQGMLASTDQRDGKTRFKIRRTFVGVPRRAYLHLNSRTLDGDGSGFGEVAQVAQEDRPRSDSKRDGEGSDATSDL